MRHYLVFFCSIFIIVGCNPASPKAPSDEAEHYEENFEIIGAERDKIIGEYSDSFLEPMERGQAEGFMTAIQDQESNFPPGRYELFPDETGVIFVYDEEENVIFKEVIDYGIESVTVDLREDYSIEVSGFTSAVRMVEAQTELSHTLSPGMWEVGTDIEAGDYIVSGNGHGYLQIFGAQETRVFEVIGNSYVQSSSNVQLQDGQKLRINGLTEINFEPNN